jgi:hypothetical protein
VTKKTAPHAQTVRAVATTVNPVFGARHYCMEGER